MKKLFAILLCALLFCQTGYASSETAQTEPTSEKSYGKKVGEKFIFGLKNSLLGWTAIFSEPLKSKYDLDRTEWEGLCNGIAKTAFYTVNGVLHLATFPIPGNFPDMGEGILPNLGKKKGPPKPWEVHGKTKVWMLPASEVVEAPEAPLMPETTPEMLQPNVQVPLAKKIPAVSKPTTSRLPASKPTTPPATLTSSQIDAKLAATRGPAETSALK